ncbi:hypothetical protein COE51_12390 [Bacillus pseudomycoides]|nr:hypothetical protein COE51_12390 [Bacillus pseudomycoides]
MRLLYFIPLFAGSRTPTSRFIENEEWGITVGMCLIGSTNHQWRNEKPLMEVSLYEFEMSV